jgi:hypothetical protein
MPPSIFLDFHLPNAATWFYFSLFLTVAVFFQFARPLSLRNFDLLTLFLLVPGFLILQEAASIAEAAKFTTSKGANEVVLDRAAGKRITGYIWLLSGSLVWFVRALVDLGLVRRPALAPNLNPAGLSCLGLALFVGLSAVALRRNAGEPVPEQVGTATAPIERVKATATAVVRQANDGATAPATARFWAERGLAIFCHAMVVLGLVLVGWRHFGDRAAGVGAATLYALVPYTAFNIGQLHHVWPTAFVVWAVYCYRRPTLAGWLLGLAAGTSVFPVVLFPVWCAFYSGRGASRFAFSFLTATAASVGVTALVLYIDGAAGQGLVSALHLSEWIPWRSASTESIWKGAHWAYRLPVFIVFVAFAVFATFWPSPKKLSHLLAQSAALLIGVQFWHADRGGEYVLWYLPLLLLMVFRPNLNALEPPPVEPGSVLVRLAGAAWRRVRGAQPTESKPLAV